IIARLGGQNGNSGLTVSDQRLPAVTGCIKPVRIVMKPLIFALCVVFAFGGLSAQKPVWQPSPGHTQVPIWPGRVPDPQPVAGPEFVTTPSDGWLVAGRPAVG